MTAAPPQSHKALGRRMQRVGQIFKIFFRPFTPEPLWTGISSPAGAECTRQGFSASPAVCFSPVFPAAAARFTEISDSWQGVWRVCPRNPAVTRLAQLGMPVYLRCRAARLHVFLSVAERPGVRWGASCRARRAGCAWQKLQHAERRTPYYMKAGFWQPGSLRDRRPS